MNYRNDRSRLIGSVVVVAALTFASGSIAAAAESTAQGLVVETVGKGSPAEIAEIAPGDVLLSWTRPSASSPTGGKLHSPFQLVRLERVEGPLGELVFTGRRGDQEKTFRLITSEHWQL